jgi:hypothetical protein
MQFGQIAEIFRSRELTWNFSDGTRIPNEDEISKTIWAAIDALRDAEDNTQVEVGRLIVKRKGSFFDVYMHASEVRIDGA